MSTNGTILQIKFDLGYKDAGMEERWVIDKTDGPVKIIASGGAVLTGILCLRIANILSGTETKAENIHWFTDVDACAIAIQQQLDHLVGADAAKINIHSFKTFCEKVFIEIEELPEYKSLNLISTVENIQLLKKLIAEFPKDHALKRYRSDVYHEIINLQSLFSFMKKEGFTSEFLLQKMNESLSELISVGESNIDFQPELSPDNKTLTEQMRAGINEFNHYQNLLQKNDRYDADDKIYLAIQAFENNRTLLSRYQEKCKYLLVDDYDTISYPAGKLLQLLLGINKQPNLLVVDYDQPTNSNPAQIPGNNPGAFTLEQYSNWETIKLEANWNNLPGKKLRFTPILRSYNSAEEEMAGIANQVYDLLQKNTATNKIAVIYEEDEYGSALERYFIVKNIPFYFKRNINILAHPFIKKIIQLLRYISSELEVPYSGDDLLFEMLHFDFFEIPPGDIAKLTVEVNSKKYSKTPTAIRKLLQERANAPAKDLFDTGIHKTLKAVSSILEKLIEDASKVSLREIFEKIIHHSLVIQYVNQSADHIGLLKLLAALSDFIQKETDRNPSLQLGELMAAIDTMEHAALPLYLSSITGNENDVQVIKAEEAIGRQFKYVFISGSNTAAHLKDDWLQSIYKLPGINITTFLNNIYKRQYRALLQLLNTALSGNSTHIFVSFAKESNEINVGSTAEFLINFFSSSSIPIKDTILTADELSDYVLLNKTKLLPEIAQPDETLIGPILKKFVMNVSALNSYLNCPLGFYYKNILRIPTGKNEAMEFGSAIHYALENLFKKMSSGYSVPPDRPGLADKQYQFPSAITMVEDFNWYMQNHRSSFASDAFERRMQYGAEVLHNYYDQYFNGWNKVVSVERNIRSTTLNGIPIKGKLDKLEFLGKEVTIVDYKSGDIDKAIPKLKGPNDNNPNGGDYWRQAVFYKILVDNYDQKDWKVISTEFDFVEPDKMKAYRKEKIVITPADIATVINQITEVWNKIQDHDFYTGCGRPDCHWCNFVKDNKLAMALHKT